MIDIDFVIAIHDEILMNEKGLKGIASMASLESCLARIDNQMLYEPLDNVYLIGAFYAQALAKAHAFNDGNKRTALVVMLTYLDMQGINIAPNSGLDDLMVSVASSEIDYKQLAQALQDLTI